MCKVKGSLVLLWTYYFKSAWLKLALRMILLTLFGEFIFPTDILELGHNRSDQRVKLVRLMTEMCHSLSRHKARREPFSTPLHHCQILLIVFLHLAELQFNHHCYVFTMHQVPSTFTCIVIRYSYDINEENR